MNNLTPFGQLIRKLRIDRLITLKDLAEKIDVTSAFLSAAETGKKEVSPALVEKIAVAMSLPEQEATDLQRAALASNKTSSLTVRFSKDLDEESMVALAAFARKFNNVSAENSEAMKRLQSLIKELGHDK